MSGYGRRHFLQGSLALAGVGLLAGCGTSQLGRQPPPKVPTLGILLFSSPATDRTINAFLGGLGELGYADGQNLTLVYRYAEGRPEHLPERAKELVQLDPDIIFALGGDVSPAAKNATATIPVVIATSSDPVQAGLIASLAHPGGNVTGVTFVSSELAGKRLQLLREADLAITRVAILWDPEHADADFEQSQAAASTLGMQLHSHEVRGANELDTALEMIASQGAQALLVVPSRLTLLHASKIGEFATQHHLPLVSGLSVFTRSGGLLSYGPNQDQAVRRAAAFVDMILKGAKPGELPVERPTAFELVLNLKTAQALGLTIPQSILQQATEIIQ